MSTCSLADRSCLCSLPAAKPSAIDAELTRDFERYKEKKRGEERRREAGGSQSSRPSQPPSASSNAAPPPQGMKMSFNDLAKAMSSSNTGKSFVLCWFVLVLARVSLVLALLIFFCYL